MDAYGTYYYTYWVLFQPTYNVWGPHIVYVMVGGLEHVFGPCFFWNMSSSQLTDFHIFQRGSCSTNQIYIMLQWDLKGNSMEFEPCWLITVWNFLK